MDRVCCIYARVSTGEQNPDHQVSVLRQYADLNGYTIYKVYVDVISGSKDSRPLLNQLMIDARNKCFSVVLVWKLDRLGRSLKHLITIAEEWRKRGVDFVCITQSIDTTTASGKFVFNILGAVAEFEREIISERTKLGMRFAKNVGKRGKDHNARRKSGYYIREAKKRGGVDLTHVFIENDT